MTEAAPAATPWQQAQAGLDTAALALDLARRAGADAGVARVSGRRGTSATVRRGEIEQLVETGSRSLGLRVFWRGRVAFASTCDFDREALQRCVADALDLAAAGDVDEMAGLPDEPGGLSRPLEQLAMFDTTALRLDSTGLIEVARAAEQAAFDADPRVTNSNGASCSSTTGWTALADSRGFAGTYVETLFGLSASALADDEAGKKQSGSWQTTRRAFGLLDSPQAVGRRAAARAVRQLGARPVATCDVPVVWEDAAAPWLIETIAEAVDGRRVYQRDSFLLDREGQPIASALVTIVDDPVLPGLPASCPFDGEGLPTQRNVLFDRGRFATFLFDTYSARKTRRRSTHSAGHGRVAPGVTSHNVFLQAGSARLEALIAGIESGLLLTGLLGGTVNLTTGDFSYGVTGVWIERGQLTFPVSEINISGRIQDLLARVDAVADDLEFHDSVAAPSFRVSHLVVSGT
jgi:PmbA protein